MPPRQRRCGARRVTSRPSYSMRTASTRASPETRLNSVVLPAPLGPRMPSVSPASTASETSSVTFSAPKDLPTRCSASSGIASALLGKQAQLGRGGDAGLGLVVDDGQLGLELLPLAPL